mmetsp:Transcript_117410/g.339442  ORF Transcript_117410/g.339442 Transcript_117410/m.339442 type:complete len:299 (-) Transcript_117410:941-1837(-)
MRSRLFVLELVLHRLQALRLLLRLQQLLVLEGALHAQDLDLVLQYLELLLQLRQVLGRLLDRGHVLVALCFHDLVHRAERPLLLANLLMLLLQVVLLQLFHRDLVGGLSAEAVRLGGVSRELLAMRGERLEVSGPRLLLRLQILELFLHLLHLSTNGLVLLFLVLLQRLLLQIGADEEIHLVLDVVEQFLLSPGVLFQAFAGLPQVLLLLVQWRNRVGDAILTILCMLVLALEALVLLLQLRELSQSEATLDTVLIQLRIEANTLRYQLQVCVLLLFQLELHFLARLVGLLRLVRHQC